MKEIRTTKLVEQTEVKFVADDGKEFETETACRAYERTCDRERVFAAFDRLDARKIKAPFINVFGGDDYAFYDINLTSKSDFVAMNDYFDVEWNVYDNDISEPKAYPCRMTVYVVSESYASVYAGDLRADLLTAASQL